jgi:hypothetical protein
MGNQTAPAGLPVGHSAGMKMAAMIWFGPHGWLRRVHGFWPGLESVYCQSVYTAYVMSFLT